MVFSEKTIVIVFVGIFVAFIVTAVATRTGGEG
jgi:hypothetical protein